jgi:hypothetical protein
MSNADQIDRKPQADETDPTDGTQNPSKSQGISKTEAKDLKVQKAPMAESQRVVANTILDQAGRDKASPKTVKAMMVAAIGESGLDPDAVDHVYHTHKGVFQSDQIPPQFVATQAHYFLIGGHSFLAGGAIGAVKDHPDWTVGMIAGHVEVSGRNSTATDPFYDRWADEADAIIEAYGGVADPSESDSSSTVAVSYEFTRGTLEHPKENSWDAAQRLAGEVEGWVLFAVANRIYYFSELKLIRQQPILTIDRTDPRVISLRGTLDNTGTATEATLELICGPFDYHAGEVFRITNAGPFSTGRWKGRWIVADTNRSVTQPTTTFTLKLAAPKGLEPAHETKPAPADAGSAPTDATVVDKLLTTAQLSGHPAPHDNVSQVAATIIAQYPELIVTSTSDHKTITTNGNVSLHVSGQAVDLAPKTGTPDPAGYMVKAAKWVAANLAQVLAEGIHNPGLSIENGETVPAAHWGDKTWAEHASHLHVAVLDSTVLTEGRTTSSSGGSTSASSGGSGGSGALWHPDAVKVVFADAGSFASGAGHKIVHHTTEGGGISGAEAAYRANGGDAPHFTFDHDANVLHQHVPLNRASRSLKHPAGTPETNRAHAIQIEHIGFAASSGSWSSTAYGRIAALCRWIEANAGVPRSCDVSFTNGAPRLSGREFFQYAGHIGHMHVPGNDHVDPGGGFRINDVI